MTDILTLGANAFSTLDAKQLTSLKSIPQDEKSAKGMWDCRSISDALFAKFNVTLAGVIEIQLLDLATRNLKGKDFKEPKDPKGSNPN